MMSSGVTASAPKVFVSHNHEDAAFCRDYVNGLRARGFDVWYDEHNLGSGDLRQVIEREMSASEHFVVILSPAAVDSAWVQREISGAIFLSDQKRLRTLLPVVASPCDIPILLRVYKRIEGPDGAPVDVAEAIARTVRAIEGHEDMPAAAPAPRVAHPAPPSATPTQAESAREERTGAALPRPPDRWKMPRPSIAYGATLATSVPIALVLLALVYSVAAILEWRIALQAQVLGALGIAVLCTVAALSAQRQPALRNPILVFSQTRSARLLFALGVGILAGYLGWTLAPTIAPHMAAGVSGVPLLAIIVVFAGGAAVITWLVVAALGRTRVSAAQCYDILKRIEWQRAAGDKWYTFPIGVAAGEIRRQSRILDLCAAQRNPMVTRRFGRYELRRDVAGIDRERRIATELPEEDAEGYREYVARLRAEANELYSIGVHGHNWRAVGREDLPALPALYEPLFGNRLDLLFNGGKGYRVGGPGGARFTTILLSGSRRMGKSTAALQLCVHLARHGRMCVYVPLEDEPEEVLQSARAFGWDGMAGLELVDGRFEYRGVTGTKVRSIPKSLEPRAVISRFEEPLPGGVLVASFDREQRDANARLASLVNGWTNLPGSSPRCVVLDNLESLLDAGLDRTGLEQIKDYFRDRCEVLVLLADAEGSVGARYLERAADTVIQFGLREDTGVPRLYVQIQLARGQSYSTSKHQAKIRSLGDVQTARGAMTTRQTDDADAPGLQIIPALDLVLINSIRQPVFDDLRVSTGLRGLDDMLGMDRAPGMRSNAALALLGPAKTGKSLIGMNFAIEGARENRPALYISLRDAEETIKRRVLPQERGRMRLSWVQVPGGSWSHRIEWSLDDLAEWADSARSKELEHPPELPYLFSTSSDDLWVAASQFLLAVASVCPSDGRPIMWTPDARRYVQAACDEAWYRLALDVGDRLAATVDANAPGHLRPQQISLHHAEGGPDAPPPTLVWDSPAYETAPGIVEYDTHLLDVKSWSPGSITPEEFIERLLRIIGSADGVQRYGRVVIDDLSYLRGRFPLLAAAPTFIPTLIDVFKARGMASLFVASFDPVSAQVDYGLEPFADSVIRTQIRYWRNDDATTPAIVEDTGNARGRIVTVEVDGWAGPPHQLWLPQHSVEQPELELRAIESYR